MFGYARPNIIIKALRKIYKMPLYVVANVAIKPNCQSLIELTNASGKNDSKNDNFGWTFDFNNLNKFKKIIEENSRETLVQNILNHEQIVPR